MSSILLWKLSWVQKEKNKTKLTIEIPLIYHEFGGFVVVFVIVGGSVIVVFILLSIYDKIPESIYSAE